MAEKELLDTLVFIDVPSEAGTHCHGQCKAPEALRKAGLVTMLEDPPYEVLNIPALCKPEPLVPTDIVNGVRNEKATLEVIEKVEQTIRSEKASRGFNVILGGDSSILQGVFYGLTQRFPNEKIGIIYFSGGVDLSLPSCTSNTGGSAGTLDSMAVTHLTQRAGGLKSMQKYCKDGGLPLVTNQNIVFYGFDPDRLDTEHWTFLLEGGFKAFSRSSIKRDSGTTAREALAWLTGRVEYFVVHFDIGVIDSGNFPLGNVPNHSGLSFADVAATLCMFLEDPSRVALVITGVNPNNDPTGEMTEDLVWKIFLSLE
ncbi:MAG: hypothetical protein M1816_001954 [Peltula sp. TS41687]|nr:MAG: hypothetical protein M1816_001954 [Peltula sp. TS41687]